VLATLPAAVRGVAARPSRSERCGAWRIHSPPA
jgi:hypothetical protein